MAYSLCKMHRFQMLVAGAILMFVTTTNVVGQRSLSNVPVPGNTFPVTLQFSPLPSVDIKKGENASASREAGRKSIEDIIAHGFGALWVRSIPGEQSKEIIKYAQLRGMKVDYMTNGFEMFNRYDPPAVSVYAAKYSREVKKQVALGLADLKKIDQINYVFPFQDEPFHAGSGSFDHSAEAKAAFHTQYGYDMPDSLEFARKDPRKWLDLLNFQSNTFRDGWQQVYKIVKDFDPRPKIAMTHDSHNSFGAGVKSNSSIAMDDVFHWGGNFADVLVYDIYPYMTFDYRYGELGKLPKPRISQMHYAISQLRNVTTTFGKDLGFWVGTYNEAWFTRFRGPVREQQYWSEREMAYTAIAQGSDFIISPSNYSGTNTPIETKHWETYGKAMAIIRKAGPGLLKAPRLKAKACFIFPRTQYLQLQEEYFNVGLSFELFLRSFGELDILHEEQVTDDDLNGYKVLVLGDVSLLPVAVAKHIESFVRKGGIVVADCVPQMGEYKQPLKMMTQLFGVHSAETGRIVQEGQWVPFTTLPMKMSFPPPADQQQAAIRTDIAAGKLFGNSFEFKVVSPRASKLTKGEIILTMKSGEAALIRNTVGKGRTYLLGFCLQDTYFQTYKDSNNVAREQLQNLLEGILRDAKVQSHIYSSNPDIEAAVRANTKEGYLFIINHESVTPRTTVRFADVGFLVAQIVDIETGEPVEFTKTKNGGEITISAPFGTTRLLRLLPRKSILATK
ncbi:MAG: hypothetical protein JWP81_3982 [Ferruginibacter sp.]|nr:hypothetical protein [Ferruginibacter sp.]